MRSKFKKVLAAVSAIAVSCTTFVGIPQSAFAADTPDYLALGDSISTGYGLASPETEGFVYLLADAIGYELTNASADGAMIGDVYTAVTSDDLRTALEDAELITLTVGGNDLMDVLYTRITDLYNEGKAAPVTVDTVKTALASGNLLTMMGYLPFAMTAL